MIDVLNNFHFLRPLWFLALFPCALLIGMLLLLHYRKSTWDQYIAPELMPHLLVSHDERQRHSPIALLVLAWLLAVLALAGPVWERLPQPTAERENALVIITDMSRSLYATDVRPNRLVRMRRKLADLLEQRNEGVTAMIVYAGDANIVTPLTDDAGNIALLLPSLSPNTLRTAEGIAWSPGSRLTPALKMAVQLFRDAGVTSGRILLVTDEIRDFNEASNVAREHQVAFPISVLAVGTATGAPIELPSVSDEPTSYLKDNEGRLVIPQVDFSQLRSFAQGADSRFSQMTLNDADIQYLLSNDPLSQMNEFQLIDERDFDAWIEEGPWLLLLLMPLVALSFRRGWIMSAALAVVLVKPPVAHAGWWDDLWEGRDQQAMDALDRGDAATAAELFEDPEWKAAAQYRNEDFKQAEQTYRRGRSPTHHYNLGNTLAHQQRLEEAIEAYDQVLEKAPDHADAAHNKAIVEQLLQQQQQQEQEQEQEQEEQSQDEESKSPDDDNQESQSQSDEQQQQEPKEEREQQITKQEQEEAVEQWLNRVPDSPGELLQRKFQIQHAERKKKGLTTASQQEQDW